MTDLIVKVFTIIATQIDRRSSSKCPPSKLYYVYIYLHLCTRDEQQHESMAMQYTSRVDHAAVWVPALLVSCRRKGVPRAEVASLRDVNLAKLLFDRTPTDTLLVSKG